MVGRIGEWQLTATQSGNEAALLQVLLKPGVMDPVAQRAEAAVADFGYSLTALRTLRKYWIEGATPRQLDVISPRILANHASEHTVAGTLPFDRLQRTSAPRVPPPVDR